MEALYTGSINKMRLQGSYDTKKVTSSDESKVSVTASANAVSGSHTIQVNALASAQYITGSKIADITNVDGTTTAVSGTTKLVDIDSALAPAAGETKINFATQDKSFALTVSENTTINDFVNAAKQAGINASYDTAQKRFFLSSSNSGVENAFSITTTAVSTNEVDAKNAIRDTVGYTGLDSASQSAVDNAIDQYKTIYDQIDAGGLTATEEEALQEKLEGAQNTINKYVQQKITSDLKTAYTNDEVSAALTTQYGVRAYSDVVAEATQSYYDKLGDNAYSDAALAAALDKAIASEAAKYATAVKSDFVANATASNPYTIATQDADDALQNLESVASTGADAVVAGGANSLSKLGVATVEATVSSDGESVSYVMSGDASKITLTKASNSEVVYNGAVITGDSNSITANGLTFDVHAVTKDLAVPQITLSVTKDTKGTYDAVKKFVKDYNEVLKEMNTLYYADTARGFEPLTDDERDSMTDDQIEKWETKIKDSLLRRDDKLGSLLSSMKNSLMTSVEYEGSSYSLASFGIGTSVYTEKGILHIDGDTDDAATSGNKDKLMAALESNPEAVMATLTKLTGNLYSEMTDKMKATSLSSAMTFYNDKELSSNLKTYKTELSDLEDRLKAIEDRYYDQFSAMETAMSKLNSQTNSLTSLMGSGN
jgi:flagellar hook-associated protein 2